jgi:RHS repeat-associated protein
MKANRRPLWRAPIALLTCVSFVAGMLPRPVHAAPDESAGTLPRASATAASAAEHASESRVAAPTSTTAPVRVDVPVATAAPAHAEVSAANGPGASPAHLALPATNPGQAVASSAGGPAPATDSLPVGGGDKTGVSSQAISVPQGSGKIQGMGESFSTQLSTGVATFSVPVALEHARGGAQPSLSLSYSSGGGHGTAGVGWDIGGPFIARQTDRGLPNYDDQDTWQPQQDRFVFNGGQELVPICNVTGTSCSGQQSGEAMPQWADGYQYFRPRVEGSYLRFFWSKDHLTWRIQSKSGVTMELGVPLDGSGDREALEADPANPGHVFRWNLAREYDNEGTPPPAGVLQPAPVNLVLYRYANVGGMDYLTDIFDTPPATNPSTAPLSQYAHHARLVYETRPDATFSYRRGWRVNQTQRLRGIDVTSVAFLAGNATRHQVRRYHLTYDSSFHVSLLTGVQVEGRCTSTGAAPEGEQGAPAEDPTTGQLPAATNCAALPPIALGYQHVAPFHADGSAGSADLAGYEGFDERITAMTASPPNSIDENMTDLFDINSDGLPDVVVTTPGMDTKFPLYLGGAGGVANAFGASRLGVVGVLGATSSQINLVNDNVAAADLDGDGTIDWLHQPAVKSYAVYTPQLLPDGWSMVGRAVPQSALQDPHLDLGEDTPDIDVFDVNGDGLVDVVRATGTEMQTFFSLGRFPGGDGNFGSATWSGALSANLSLQFVSSCMPVSSPGVPIRFSDSAVHLADMNGDGLQDIVYTQQGNIEYWPGRGDGSWGTAALGGCTSGAAQGTGIPMSNSPQYSDPSGTGLRFDDVNGDGLDDVVQVRFDAVDVWLNVDGTSWTQRHVIQGVQPASGPLWVGKVRVADVNGSGTRDILWGEGGSYRYIDLSGGQRPWVLTHIDNGLGKTTDIEYSTSTAQMLSAEAAGNPWSSKAPTPVHVVDRVTEHDNLGLVGLPAGNYVTQYTYRDAVYDGRQREFRGFRSTIARRVGDANSPSSTTSTEFLLGECADDEPPPAGLTSRCTPAGRWADNGREALKGLPVVQETFDDGGVYLSSEHHQYTLRKLYTGEDGREVRVAFESQGDTWKYDTASFAPSKSAPGLADVVLDQVPGPEPSTPLPLVERASVGTAHTRSASTVDVFGNATASIASGCVDGDPAVCPAADEVITTFMVPGLVPGDASGWLWRTIRSYVQGADGVARRDTRFTYDANGHPTLMQAQLAGTAQLDRFHEPATAANPSTATAGNSAPLASQDGVVTISQSQYGPFGNLLSQSGPNGRCRIITYASDYSDLPIAETVFVGPLAAGTACPAGQKPRGGNALTATAGYDRGFAAVTNVVDLHQEPSLASYDALGRMASLTKPSAAGPALSAIPSVVLDYDLARPDRSFSIVHSRVHVGQNESDSSATAFRDAYAYADGFTRTVVTLGQADPAVGDGGGWIVDGLTAYDAKGAVSRRHLASFYSGDPRAFPLSQPPSTPYGRQRYDAFGRQLQTFGLDGAITLQSAYHALSVDKADAADLSPGPHQGTPASARTDGHGRTIAVTERIHNGSTIESRETRTTYLPTSEPRLITRVRLGAGDAPVLRWLAYDTLGRMVLNAEPDTTRNFSPDPTTFSVAPSTMKAWRYAYDDNGDLVGTSDARGCGANYLYDAGGRIVAEDFSPCLAAQQPYSAPDLTTGNGTEAFYQYDALDAGISSIPNFPIDGTLLLGRLVAVSDRGAKTITRYDGRGRATGVARHIAAPGTPSDTISSRYAPKWYVLAVAFDAADRPVSATTGVDSDVPELLDANGQSVITTQYSQRGTVQSVGSGYGPLVTSIVRDADGPITQTVFGDAAGTTSAFSYDARRRLASVQTFRGAPAIWSSPPASYSPAPDTNPSDPPTTLQLLLEDVDYHYDAVDNPVEIDDFRNPAEWPAGAQPVSRKIQYDDLYRVTRVDYQFPGGTDTWVSPFLAEDTGVNADPRRAPPSPHVNFANRTLFETFKYDWLGNTTSTDDDVHGFYDRSLGAITNGTAGAGPYQLQSATGSDPSLGGHLGASYDSAGNLASLTVARSGPCLPAGVSCSQQYLYDWDEVGRLVRARRLDGSATAPSADLSYAYDANDDRVLKSAVDAGTSAVYSAYIFGSLELRDTTWNGTDYARSSSTEVAYLWAHGTRLARLHFALDSEPTLTSGKLHVLLELPDHLGSTTIVVDKDTSELVERGTYTACGQGESDYRAARWNAFREDHRFTGKEEDVEVGLEYFGKRYFAPSLGRWLSADPLAVLIAGGDVNLYAYVTGRLLSARDPVGLQAVCPKDGPCSPEVLEAQKTEDAERQKQDPVYAFEKNHPTLARILDFVQAAGAVWFIAHDLSQLANGSISTSVNNIQRETDSEEAALQRAAAGETAAAEDSSVTATATKPASALPSQPAVTEPPPQAQPQPAPAPKEPPPPRLLYRSMKGDRAPELGPSKRTLGAVIGPPPRGDIEVCDGCVRPGTGGMSVSPDSPWNLPEFRRPPSFGGTGKDRVWVIQESALGIDLKFKQDTPTHGGIEPARVMTPEDFQKALAATVERWKKL